MPQGKCERKARDKEGKKQKDRIGKARSKGEQAGGDVSLAHETMVEMCAGGRGLPPHNVLPSFIDLKKEPLRKSTAVLGTLVL